MSYKPKVRTDFPVNAYDGVTFTPVPCSIWCRKMVIEEVVDDPDTETLEGLAYVSDADGYKQIVVLPAGTPIVIGNPVAEGRGAGPLVGVPAQGMPDGATKSATVPVKVSSATTAMTQVRITEHS